MREVVKQVKGESDTYGKRHGVAGKEGVLHFLETRSQYERELLAHLQLPHTILLQNAGLDRERI